MAFIFVPNADGGFTEGDKQTNPDTGVEYIYSDGAWRALGPKIEDEFGTLDERYVKLTGTTRTTGTWKIKGDNEAGDGEQTFQSIGGGYQKLYNIKTPEDSNTGWVANVEYVQQKIAAIPPVDLDGYATETYVDDAIENINPTGKYLPITGGTLTGALKILQRPLEFLKPDNTNQMKLGPNGGDYWNNIWAFNAAGGNGGFRFRVAEDDGNVNYKTFLSATYKDNTVGSVTHPMEVSLSWLRTPTANHHAANKQYVDDLQETLMEEIGKVGSPPALYWKRVDKGAESLAVGEFYISANNNNIYLHPKAIGNIDLNMESSADKVTGIKHMVSVHKYNGAINYSIVCNEISFNNGSNKYIRLSANEVLCNDYTSEEQECRLNIPGFTF